MIVENAVTVGARPALRPAAVPRVFVVDGDDAARGALDAVVRAEGWQAETVAAAAAFLSRPAPAGPSCLVLDVTTPADVDVQRHIAAARPDMPIIVVLDPADVALTVQTMKAGAAEVFVKPIDDDGMANALRQSLARSATARAHQAGLAALRDRYDGLSAREREVMALVVSGRTNKQVGRALGITEITVKVHRGRAMRKMQAASLVDLVHMAEGLGLVDSPFNRAFG